MIAVGADHGGLALKQEVVAHLLSHGISYKDYGTFTPESCDYPDFAKPVAEAVASGECEKGILICTTGIGISIAANKVRGVRAALCGDPLSARKTRQHNDANILCLGGDIVGPGLAREMVDIFLNTPFEGGRHQRRVDKITAMEGAPAAKAASGPAAAVAAAAAARPEAPAPASPPEDGPRPIRSRPGLNSRLIDSKLADIRNRPEPPPDVPPDTDAPPSDRPERPIRRPRPPRR